MQTDHEKTYPTPEIIVRECCKMLALEKAELEGYRSTAKAMLAKHLIALACRKLEYPYTDIAEATNSSITACSNWYTVGCRRVKDEEYFRELYAELRKISSI